MESPPGLGVKPQHIMIKHGVLPNAVFIWSHLGFVPGTEDIG